MALIEHPTREILNERAMKEFAEGKSYLVSVRGMNGTYIHAAFEPHEDPGVRAMVLGWTERRK
jgi:hypothetical protein